MDLSSYDEKSLKIELDDNILNMKKRFAAISKVHDFLLLIKDKVKIRKDLYPYLDIKFEIRQILRDFGWRPLDPWFANEDEEWNNAKIIINDSTIREALEAFKIPRNRDWCNCLASDFN